MKIMRVRLLMVKSKIDLLFLLNQRKGVVNVADIQPSRIPVQARPPLQNARQCVPRETGGTAAGILIQVAVVGKVAIQAAILNGQETAVTSHIFQPLPEELL